MIYRVQGGVGLSAMLVAMGDARETWVVLLALWLLYFSILTIAKGE